MPSGLICNQVGYDNRHSVRFFFRSDLSNSLPEGTFWGIIREDTLILQEEQKWSYRGTNWRSHWWEGTVKLDNPGHYLLQTRDQHGRNYQQRIEVLEKPYFKKTWEHVALKQFERRSQIPSVPGKGWVDCGAHMSEANSHAVSVMGMCLYLREKGSDLSKEWRERLLKQIRHGVVYFLFIAEEGEKQGLPEGTYQHEPAHQPKIWLLEDSLQIGYALCLCSRILEQEGEGETAARCLAQARKTWKHLHQDEAALIADMRRLAPPPRPDGAVHMRHFSTQTNALPPNTPEPDVFLTREHCLHLQFLLELDQLCGEDLSEEIAGKADKIVERFYEPGEVPEGAPHNWFIPFPGATQAETAWSHNSLGRDTGAVFPHFIMPLYKAAQTHANHPHASRWRATVDKFIAGYLKPATLANPFSLLPNTYKEKEGWLHFAGLWHGMNGTYALMAMQAFYFFQQTGESWLYDFGKAQLDWIAGLNCGVTSNSFYGCTMYDRDVPEEAVLAVSMIQGIGQEFAGNWRTIRGSICNGFSRGVQFRFDVEPLVAEDFPDTLTDEDWITHAGAWLAALAYCDL